MACLRFRECLADAVSVQRVTPRWGAPFPVATCEIKYLTDKQINLNIVRTLIAHYHFLVAFSLAMLPQLVPCLEVDGTITACYCRC